MTVLSIENVSKRYGKVQALDQVSVEATSGMRTAVVGPSGSGKTTLLRMIAGFETPDGGRVSVGGEMLADAATSVPAHLRSIGIVAQDGALFPHLTVADNIGFGISRTDRQRNERILSLLDMVELDQGMLSRRPHQLSGGQQQRVALARALACRPRLMLLDEPFSALDTGLRENMRKTVSRLLQSAGVTTILVTHDQEEALSFADRVVVMREGRVVQAGTPLELYFHPKDRATALFMGDAVLLPAIAKGSIANCALGNVSIAGHHKGKVEIMLRPEQIRIASDSGSDDTTGQVVDVEFSGATSTIAVALNGAALPPIRIKTSSVALPSPGSYVRLDVAEKAHVLEA